MHDVGFLCIIPQVPGGGGLGVCIQIQDYADSLAISGYDLPPPLHRREVFRCLLQLGLPAQTEDDMLVTIRSEVQRLGTMATIKRDVIQSEQRGTTDYVIERPRPLLSTRDYLNDRTR